ncbi:astacin-like metalloendopeptidase [Temnothorax curvispinosus]|uniref:Metalloendopeptidase n=1 Tax=Temnothorax curvispinosus TaxID=300111 RepID=A0A6J1QIH0_9HYME|nr:astacin-like metalloendopeptidase [Temnothorax curvispinosus]
MTPEMETGDRVAHWKKEMKVNPEELGNYLEGDIMLTEDHQEHINYWPDVIIPTIFSGDFNQNEVIRILDAMETIHRNTCIRFKTIYMKNELNWRDERGYIIITSKKTGCWCQGIGKIDSGQQINLQTPACTRTHTIIHELLHALGLDHEHNRVDRDLYVMINWTNISEDMHYKHHNFYMRKTNYTLGLPYDYDSIMHYSPYAFAKYPNLTTITTKAPNKSIGEAKILSKLDILKINIMCNCSRYLRKEDIDKVNNWINKDLVCQKKIVN